MRRVSRHSRATSLFRFRQESGGHFPSSMPTEQGDKEITGQAFIVAQPDRMENFQDDFSPEIQPERPVSRQQDQSQPKPVAPTFEAAPVVTSPIRYAEVNK